MNLIFGGFYQCVNASESLTNLTYSWAQLFKTNDIVSLHIVKTLIIKYGIHTNIFAEKCE